jgi:hypothetical protein
VVNAESAPLAAPAPPSSPPRARRVAALLAVLLVGALPGLSDLRDFWNGSIACWAWVHDPGARRHWAAYIHPPGYREVMAAFTAAADATGWRRAELGAVVNVAVSAALAWLLWSGLRRWGAGRWAWLAVLLIGLSPAAMRPFDHYPVAKLLGTAALLALLRGTDASSSAAAGRRRLLVASLLSLLAVEVHLNLWFLIGPMLAALWIGIPQQRRELAWIAFAIVAAFLVTAFPPFAKQGLLDVLSGGPNHPEAWQRPLRWDVVTIERNNPWMFLPPLLWLIPAVRRASARPAVGFAAAAAVFSYAATVALLMYLGFCIGGNFRGCHHYFELADPLMTCVAVWALADAWRALDAGWRGLAGRGLAAGLVLAGGLGLLATQAELRFRGWRAMWYEARENAAAVEAAGGTGLLGNPR